MELKSIIIFIMIILIIYNIITYEPVNSEIFGNGSPSFKSIILTLISMGLFVYGLYLNDNPVYLN